MSFGGNLSYLRQRAKLTQYELADKLKLSRGQIANYEQGKREPDFATLTMIADFFDVTIDFMLDREKEVIELDNDKKMVDIIDAEFIQWVNEHVDEQFFYHFHEMKEEEKHQHMQDLRFLYEREQFKKSKK